MDRGYRSSRIAAGVLTIIHGVAWGAAAADSPVTSGEPEAQLVEIVVTAQRRAESVQKTPIAIQVLSGEQLRNQAITSEEDLTKVVPGLAVWRQGGGMTSIYLRGVGSEVQNSFADLAVAQNIDGVYIARGEALSGAFLDLQRIEVLNGPQGTLYGRNATGGAVNYITNKPGPDFGGDLTVGFGSYARREVNAALNLPVSDTLATRLAVGYVAHDGYLQRSGMDDQETVATRFSALFKPTEDLSILAALDYSRDGGNGVGQVVMVPNASHATVATSNPWSGPAIGYYPPLNAGGGMKVANPGCIYAPASNPRSCVNPSSLPTTTVLDPNFYGPGVAGVGVTPGSIGTWAPGSALNNQTLGVMTQLDWNLAFGTLTVLPAYRHTVRNDAATLGGFAEVVDVPANQTSLEVRIASPASSAVKWVGGLYYFNERQFADENYLDFNQAPNFLYAGAIPGYDPSIPILTNQGYFARRYHLGDTSAAAFGQATFPVREDLRLTAGARYNYERKTASGYAPIGMPEYAGIFGPGSVNPSCPVGIGGTVYVSASSQCDLQIAGVLKSSYTTWRAGIEYDLTADSMLYANASTGFHAGGFNDGLNGPGYSNTYKPETITAYTIGIKNEFFRRRLLANVELFDWQFKNKQFGTLTAIYPPTVALPILNVGNLPERGVDFQVNYLATEHDVFGVNLDYLQATFSHFVFAPATGSTECSAVVPMRFSGVGSPFVDCAGKRYPNIPKWSSMLTYRHTFNLSVTSDLAAEVRSHIQSGVDLLMGAKPFAQQSGYSKTELSLSYINKPSQITVTAWVDNVENSAVLTNAQASFNAGNGDPTFWGNLLDPRTYGVRVLWNFGR
jgi:iron complex outermembrane receptor protein